MSSDYLYTGLKVSLFNRRTYW